MILWAEAQEGSAFTEKVLLAEDAVRQDTQFSVVSAVRRVFDSVQAGSCGRSPHEANSSERVKPSPPCTSQTGVV